MIQLLKHSPGCVYRMLEIRKSSLFASVLVADKWASIALRNSTLATHMTVNSYLRKDTAVIENENLRNATGSNITNTFQNTSVHGT